jgi:hypothetical protein
LSKSIAAKSLISFQVAVLRQAQHERFWRLIEVPKRLTAVSIRLSGNKWLKKRMDTAVRLRARQSLLSGFLRGSGVLTPLSNAQALIPCAFSGINARRTAQNLR